ncbi:Alpha/Beta hydrolase protein [Zychaea mexicana]|uniref:Alpha/Beta hydrolase protein n=1 Tax=Zychaea mexicana TaxID=64656 RepID=UPI0022FF20FA|nr:Alpha/Beta hydrolase protein [Zychaea mexicana]KAI9496494.1 Alpha/Beta hydrolase protein [Zychaea mexicana]
MSKRIVSLAFEKYATAAKSHAGPPLIISHGLFGSKQNWRTLAKVFSTRLSRDVYTVDLRNHGDSCRSDVHTFDSMANDLTQFIADQGLEQPVLVGHSMGGKASMACALQSPTAISHLVVIDMPPVPLSYVLRFGKYVEAFRAIKERRPDRLATASKILEQYEPNQGVRSFLLTNLRRNEATGSYSIKANYETLGKSLDDIAAFDTQGTFAKPTLFIAGGDSPYRQKFLVYRDTIRAMFPNSTLETIEGAGHWVHADQPEAFVKLMIKTFMPSGSH